jgi:hypothetical protein
MSSQWKKRRRRAESVAEEAWDQLVSALDNARAFGGTVKDRASDLRDRASDRASDVRGRTSDWRDRASDLADDAAGRYGKASHRVGEASTEAWRRANSALDALSGKRQRKPWGWIAVAVLGGVAVGWAVAAAAPKVIQAASDRLAIDADEPDELPPTAEPPAPYESATPSTARPRTGAGPRSFLLFGCTCCSAVLVVQLYLRSSRRAREALWTSSGPSARRRVRALDHSCARGVSWLTPAAP